MNNEGTVRDSNQTKKTVTRAGVGAALGALIGAIAGGGSGAAIGAAVGAGAGAGSVLIQGRDNVELGQGTEFNITATGPTECRALSVRHKCTEGRQSVALPVRYLNSGRQRDMAKQQSKRLSATLSGRE